MKYRDVSYGLQKLRDFLLGRKHTLHCRFPPLVASRTIPPVEIARGPDLNYSDKYYVDRNAFHSVLPPVIAPIAEGPVLKDPQSKCAKSLRPDAICFNFAPTPGPAWWWDGHCYYESVPDPPKPTPTIKPSSCPSPCDNQNPSK